MWSNSLKGLLGFMVLDMDLGCSTLFIVIESEIHKILSLVQVFGGIDLV